MHTVEKFDEGINVTYAMCVKRKTECCCENNLEKVRERASAYKTK